jgi:uridine monophosphate synthetase
MHDSLAPTEAELADVLLRAGCLRFGQFVMKSGLASPIYLDLRRLASFPAALRTVAAAYAPTLGTLAYDCMAAIPTAGLPIGTALALALDQPMIYPRIEVKDHGTQVLVEGAYTPGQTVVVVDDVATKGVSTLAGVERLRQAGLQVRDVVVLINREQGAAEALAEAGCRLYAVLTLRRLVDICHAAGRVSDAQLAEVAAYLR